MSTKQPGKRSCDAKQLGRKENPAQAQGNPGGVLCVCGVFHVFMGGAGHSRERGIGEAGLSA